MGGAESSLDFALKIASRCNLNCSYCYVYNKGDETWRNRPATMSDEIFAATIHRIRRHCVSSGQRSVRIIFHGGEPCLIGHAHFAAWCQFAREALQDLVKVSFSIQTNGTLLHEGWIEVFQFYDVSVGISSDGPKEIHNAYRVDHAGRGSYDAVARGISVLHEAGIPLHILSVIKLGTDPLITHRHFVDIGADYIDYLLPDFTHDTIEPVRARYGPTPCADFLIPVFDDWWFNGTLDLTIGLFWNIARMVMGGNSEIDLLGNRPFRFIFVESDGAIEGLDVIRVCKQGMAYTGLNVLTNDFRDIAQVSALHSAAIFGDIALPSDCRSCRERLTCGGGYLPHRYSTEREFDNPSVWCEDLLLLFGHIRNRLGVSAAETETRRQMLLESGILSASSSS